MSRLSDTLHGGPVDTSEIERVRDSVIFEGADWQRRVVRFVVLLVLASAIATYGLLSDSVAAVIGAMIVAPLMGPIVGLAFAISIGDRKSILTSTAMVALGICLAILVGLFLVIPFRFANPEANAQIMARTAPRLVDLLAALATGLAGAFAVSRSDVSDTLPGVAIAISLVPPLANVGLLLGLGRPELARGSALLFATNFLAIVLTGAFMFGIMGFPKAVLGSESKKARLTAIAVVGVLSVAIIAPLTLGSVRVIAQTVSERNATDAANAWVEGSGYQVDGVRSADGTVTVTVVGRGKIPPIASLREDVAGKLAGKALVVRAVPLTVYTVTTP
ncbi:MAG TPA: TIGR00341 family protein [Coriobacteriia bacterium]|nr:TIGR00341 family protein [Coriobacteriia bacterium]